jgi:hypothetical protein
MHDQTTPGRAGEPEPVPGTHSVTVLSVSVLRAARAGHRESRPDFAARAGVGVHVVEGAEDGACPVWELPYDTFSALGEAVAVLNPSLRTVFETAAACDLLLTSVMRGDQVFSTDVLADDDTRDLAVGLLRWAATGEFRLPEYAGCMQVPVLWAWHEECGGWICPACGGCQCETGVWRCGHHGQLVGDADLALLQRKASALARSASPDAWVGVEILVVLGGAR